jgi:hemolysin activation/secretion protein
VDGDFQARHVSSDEDGPPTGWRDILWELNGTGYWAFSENSTLTGRILVTSGSRMDRPFQLTLGGREAVRSYNEDAFPGAKRFLATLEQRIPFPGLSIPFADLGLAGFVDAGKMWAGTVPYGAESKWEAGVGLGIRIGLPAGGHNVLRMDLGIPVTGQREEKGVVFRLYTELFGLLERRFWPTQTDRSRWYGVEPDLTTRPLNPLAGT